MTVLGMIIFIIACIETCGCIALMTDIKKERKQLRKYNKKNIHYILPFAFNGLVSFYIFYWCLLALTFMWHGFNPTFIGYQTLIPMLIQIMVDVLAYIWFYSKKTDLTKKEYVKTCLLGANVMWIYVAYMQFL